MDKLLNRTVILALVALTAIWLGLFLNFIWISEPWWFNGFIALAGVIIATWLAIHQLKENYRHKVKLETYEKIADQIYRVHKSSNLAIYGFSEDNIESLKDVVNLEKFFNDFTRFSDEVLNVIYLWEKYEIVLQDFKIYEIAFLSAQHDLRTSFYDLHEALIKYAIQQQDPLEIGLLGKIRPFNKACSQIQDWTHDFRIDAQNVLMGKLFNNHLAGRKPQDPTNIVLSIRESAKLEKYFMEQTDWGKIRSRYINKEE